MPCANKQLRNAGLAEVFRLRCVGAIEVHAGNGRINIGVCFPGFRDFSRRDYQALRTWSGVAPVTKQNGKSRVVVRRYAAHVRLRDAVYHWARLLAAGSVGSRHT